MISIISTGSIKRTGLVIFPKFPLNVLYDIKLGPISAKRTVSIKRTVLL